MDRAERTGLGLALAGHALLFGALSLNLLRPPVLPRLETSPVEVSLVDEVALQSTAPAPQPEAALPAPEIVEAPAPAPAPAAQPAPKAAARAELKPAAKTEAKPVVRRETAAAAKPAGKPAAKPVAREAAADDRPRRRPGLSRDILAGISPEPAARTQPATATGAPATAIGPAVASSIGAEVRRQLKPHWKSPAGADVELLRTTLSVRLNRDGSIAGAPELVAQTGVNASNRAQARLHVDQAIRAVRLAAPFKLPVEYYDAWREIRPSFDRRLSQ